MTKIATRRHTSHTFTGCKWSNGRALNRAEKHRLAGMLDSGRVNMLPGETPILWFARIRGVLEGAFIDPRSALKSKGNA